MKKIFIWMIFLVAGACVILWSAQSGSKPANQQPIAKTPEGNQPDRKSGFERNETVDPEATGGRESPRNAADEMEKHRLDRLATLDKAVRDQEEKVEERRKALVAIVRSRGIIYQGNDSVGVGSREKNNADVQDYQEAKLGFEADQQYLQEIKLKLIQEKINAARQ
jgi:hypothetical protein